MTIQRAIEVLTEYNIWRRHEGEPCNFKYSGMELGAAIDVAVHCLWKTGKIAEIINFGEGGQMENGQETLCSKEV